MNIAMTTADYMAALNILVAIIGVMFVVFTLFEFVELKKLRKEFKQFREELAAEHYRHQQAAHKVIASYGVTDFDAKIALLEQAIKIDPSVFNGHNSLGYAYIDKGDFLKAADAFKWSVQLHPEDKAGYCDLAYAYLKLGDTDLCRKYLKEAVKVDVTALDDIVTDSRFSAILPL